MWDVEENMERFVSFPSVMPCQQMLVQSNLETTPLHYCVLSHSLLQPDVDTDITSSWFYEKPLKIILNKIQF